MAKQETAAEDLAEFWECVQKLAEPNRAWAGRLYDIALEVAPDLHPKVWYGMPAFFWQGKNLFFFQSGIKYKTRYCTLGFIDSAHLDDGDMWPSAYAISQLTPEVESRIRQLIARAIS